MACAWCIVVIWLLLSVANLATYIFGYRAGQRAAAKTCGRAHWNGKN